MSSHIAVSNEVFDLRVEPASTHLICGPSNSGKTVKVANILKHKDSYIKGGSNIKNIVFCYAAWQEIYSELDSNGIVSKWVNKMPTNEQFIELVSDHKEDGSIVILDDFMQDISRDLVQIVCVSSRHYNTTTFILFQSLFPAHPLARQISLNVKYIYLLKNPREKNQIQVLARQLLPGDHQWLVAAYHEATKEAYGCLLIDMTQQIPEELRFRSNVLPNEMPTIIWTKA